MSTIVEGLRTDLSHLNDCATESVTALAASVIEFLIHKNSKNFQTSLEEFAGTGALSPAALKASTRGLIVLFESGMREGWSAGQIHTECSRVDLSEEVSTILRLEWARNASHIASKLLAKTIAANELVDMDWSFGVTASSNDCDQMGKTYLQMKLTIRNDDDATTTGIGGVRDVFVELSLDQFYSFLSQIERCKSYLDAMNKATNGGIAGEEVTFEADEESTAAV